MIGRTCCEDIAWWDVTEQGDGVTCEFLHLWEGVVGTEIEQVYANLGKVRCADQAIGIVMEEFHLDVTRLENSPKVRQCCVLEVIVSKEANDVIEDEYAVDRWEGFGLKSEPVNYEIRDSCEQVSDLVSIGANGREKFCGAEEK